MKIQIIILIGLILLSGCSQPPEVPTCEDINKVGINCDRYYDNNTVCKEIITFYGWGNDGVVRYCPDTINKST